MPPPRHELAPKERADVLRSARRAFCTSYREFHFSAPGTHCRVRTKEAVEGDPMKTDVGWTERMRHDKTASPQTDHFNSVRSHACSTLAGLERLQADLCRALAWVHTRPSALPDLILRWPRSQDARLWQSREDGLHRIPLPALWPGQALGSDELSIVIVP